MIIHGSTDAIMSGGLLMGKGMMYEVLVADHFSSICRSAIHGERAINNMHLILLTPSTNSGQSTLLN